MKKGSLYMEVSPLLASPLAGIGRFVARLVEALSQVAPLHLVNLASEDLKLSGALPYGKEIRVSFDDLPEVGSDLDLWVRRLLQRDHYDHDFQLASELPGVFTLLRPAERHFRREVCILYDFTPLVLPWTHLPEIRTEFGKFFAVTSNLCEKAVAISEATKNDAKWLCAIPTENVVVGYPGPSLCTHKHAFLGKVDRRDKLIVVVSTLEPRKNAQFLLDWFLMTDVLLPGTQIWWVGAKGWLSDLSRKARTLETNDRKIRFLGKVSDERLCELYRRATFTIYPSLYEGFGFPVLDSLLHGTPVVSSLNSSLQEFAGPGVFYFDPCDANSLDDACRELLACLPLRHDRNDLGVRFSWERLAQTVMSLCFD